MKFRISISYGLIFISFFILSILTLNLFYAVLFFSFSAVYLFQFLIQEQLSKKLSIKINTAILTISGFYLDYDLGERNQDEKELDFLGHTLITCMGLFSTILVYIGGMLLYLFTGSIFPLVFAAVSIIISIIQILPLAQLPGGRLFGRLYMILAKKDFSDVKRVLDIYGNLLIAILGIFLFINLDITIFIIFACYIAIVNLEWFKKEVK